jgi:hypothetical protein
MITRRAAVSLLPAVGLYASDFWREKEPSAWSDKDAEKLLNRSPWAKEMSVEVAGGPSPLGPPPSGGGRGGRGRVTPASSGTTTGESTTGSRLGSTDDADAAMRQRPQTRVLIRWETALPVREAAKSNLPADVVAKYYVVTTVGLKALFGPRKDESPLEPLMKESVTLQRKGKDPLLPEHITTPKTQPNVALFFFPRGAGDIKIEDHDVTFVVKSKTELKAKFSLKDMVYHDKLEL